MPRDEGRTNSDAAARRSLTVCRWDSADVCVPDEDAAAFVGALSDATLGEEGFDGSELPAWGIAIVELIAIVRQMSEHYSD